MHMLLQALLLLIPLVLSLTVHEAAHAWAARALGDSTAERAGRLTLNPLAHADPVGTVFLPLCMLMAQGVSGLGGLPLLGWAKPTPVDPTRLTRKISGRHGEMLVALAGPASNLLVALLLVVGTALALRTRGAGAPDTQTLTYLAQVMVLNVGLAIFNLLPIAPLDGEKVVLGVLPLPLSLRYAAFSERFGTVILLGIIIVGRPYLAVPIRFVAGGLWRVLTLLA